jgi:uncharacterized HAD superfamily protein
MFEIQMRINEHLKDLTIEQKEEHTKQFVLATMVELTELLAETNWTTWKKPISVIESNVVEEAVDTLKFLMNIFIIWGLDENALFEAFERKSMVVEQRFKQFKVLKEIKESGKKVCAIDLDGVLVEYPNMFIEFVNSKMPKGHVPFTNLFEVKKGITNEQYLEFKHMYRETGMKQHLPLNSGALRFVHKLKDMGYSVVIITKRPYKKYFRLFADTKKNLDGHGVPYDAILFDTEKHKTIVKELPQLEFMVEDNKTIANEVGSWSYKCFLMDNMYNQGDTHANVVRVKSFDEILEKLNEQAAN